MPRRNPIKRRNKHKHLFVDDLEDPVLEPRTSTTRVPIDWEVGADGEDTPVFAIEYAYTEKELEPYTAYPHLYWGRKYVERPMGMPFPFLELPPELRVEIYRHCLVSVYAIDLIELKFKIDWRDRIAAHVLRTCRRINAEGSQVLYGDNDIRIWRSGDFVLAPFILKHNFDWLRELTMRVPFMGESAVLVHDTTRQNAGKITSSQSIFKPSRYNLEETRLFRNLLCCIIRAPHLRRLHLVFFSLWHWPIRREWGEISYPRGDSYHWVDRSAFILHDPETWDDLKTLLEHKPTLEVTVTTLHNHFGWGDSQRDQDVLLRRLRHKLGIWDHREAWLGLGDDNWTMPPRTEINPEVSQRDMNLLFGDI